MFLCFGDGFLFGGLYFGCGGMGGGGDLMFFEFMGFINVIV